jgi:ankyrin repeat protein
MLTKQSKNISFQPPITSSMLPNEFNEATLKNNLTKYHFGQSTATAPTSSALHQSILSGRLKQVKYFLKLGINVNAKDMYGRTALMLTCLSDLEDYGLKVAKLLLQYGADMNECDFMGRSAVFLACSQIREKLVELFVVKNTTMLELHQKDNDGDILLNHAAIHGTPRMVKMIIDKMIKQKMPIDERNNLGYTALLLVRSDLYLKKNGFI